MSVITTDLSTTVTLFDHLLPVLITTAIVSVIWILVRYIPQIHYIALVSKATDDTGVIELAKYMAKRNGGRHIDTSHLWESFVPAAREVSRTYRSRPLENEY